jgi:hypothetical protein
LGASSLALSVTPLEAPCGTVRLQFEGRVGVSAFLVQPRLLAEDLEEPETVRTAISPAWRLGEALRGGVLHTPGDLSDVDGSVVAVEGFVAEFLADVSVTRSARRGSAAERHRASAPGRCPAPGSAMPGGGFEGAPGVRRTARRAFSA